MNSPVLSRTEYSEPTHTRVELHVLAGCDVDAVAIAEFDRCPAIREVKVVELDDVGSDVGSSEYDADRAAELAAWIRRVRAQAAFMAARDAERSAS